MNIVDGIINYNNSYNRYPNVGSGIGLGNPFNVASNLINFGNQTNVGGRSYLGPNNNDPGIFSNLLGNSNIVTTGPTTLWGMFKKSITNTFTDVFRNIGGVLSMFGVGRNENNSNGFFDNLANSWDFSQNGGGRDALTTAMSGVLGTGCDLVATGINYFGGSELPVLDILAADAGDYCNGVGESWGNSISDMIHQDDFENNPFILK